MAHRARKTEHTGAKHGRGAYWGPKNEAKRESNKLRRKNQREEISEAMATLGAMEIQYTSLTFKEGKTYVAQAVELDVSSCGETREKALNNLKEAVRLFIEEADKLGTLTQILEQVRKREREEIAALSGAEQPPTITKAISESDGRFQTGRYEK